MQTARCVRRGVVFVSLAYVVATPAFAQTPPTDIDLKAAYCIKVNQIIVGQLSGPEAKPAAMAQAAIDARDHLNRLQSYLLPRMRYLDAVGLVAAAKRAEIDAVQVTILVNRCLTQQRAECQAVGGIKLECLKELQLCMQGELNDRWTSCSNLTWLPF